MLHADANPAGSFAEGQAGRDRGMTQAVDHADALVPGWSAEAAQKLHDFLKEFRDPFIAPDVREWAYRRGLPKPPTNMSWGAVFMSFSKRGLIRKVGYRQYGDKTMHTQPVVVWERASALDS